MTAAAFAAVFTSGSIRVISAPLSAQVSSLSIATTAQAPGGRVVNRAVRPLQCRIKGPVFCKGGLVWSGMVGARWLGRLGRVGTGQETGDSADCGWMQVGTKNSFDAWRPMRLTTTTH